MSDVQVIQEYLDTQTTEELQISKPARVSKKSALTPAVVSAIITALRNRWTYRQIKDHAYNRTPPVLLTSAQVRLVHRMLKAELGRRAAEVAVEPVIDETPDTPTLEML